MLRVKVCGMNNPGNVKEIAELKPDFMGFLFFAESPRFVGHEPEMELFNNVPPGIKKSGVFYNEDNNKILKLSVLTGLDMIQLHGNESPPACLQLKSSGLAVVKAFNIDRYFHFDSLKQYMPVCDYFLFDTKSEKPGGSGKKFAWEKLKEYNLDKPFFLSGGIFPHDAAEIESIGNRGLFAVDINSRFETSPGIKDAVRVKTFINEIKKISYDL
jgi:phosphoribosylanthranilate isomerase